MNAIYFTGVGQAILVSALLLSKQHRRPVDFILVVWMVLSAFQLVFFYLNFVDVVDAFPPRLMLTGGLMQFIGAPLLFIYIRSLTRPYWKPREIVPHAIPFIFFFVLFQILYQGGNMFVSDGFIHVRVANELAKNYSSFLALTSLIYPLVSLRALRQHRRQIENEFSYNEEITLNWLNHWVILELMGFVISYLVIWAAEFDILEYVQSFQVLAAIILLNVFIVGFFGLKQPIIFEEERNDQSEEKYQNSRLAAERVKEIVATLEGHMVNDQPFLDPKLSLNVLAQQINVSKHDLSHVLNEGLETNFYDFVNRHRVQSFKQRVASGKYGHLSTLGLALDCGFNSKSSFNQVFKKMEGLTPTEYKKTLTLPAQ